MAKAMKDRPLYYGMDGKPLDQEGFIQLFTDRHGKKRRVALTELANGYNVSTVLLGIDHNFSMTGPPIIFETMVFYRPTGRSDYECQRYSTKAEAEAGHMAMVAKWAKKPPPGPSDEPVRDDPDIRNTPKDDGPDDA